MVYDFRPIKVETIDSAYPCYDVDVNLDIIGLGRLKVFSTTDASNGFWAILMYPPPHQFKSFNAC